jgi:hypothetical protein
MIDWLYRFLVAALIGTASCAPGGVQEAAVKREQMAKVSQDLTALYDEYSRYMAARQTVRFQSANSLVQVIEDRVLIDAVASGDPAVLKSDLAGLGMRQAVAFGRIVSGQWPISAIPSMAALTTLKSARAAAAALQDSPRSLPPGTSNR